MGTFNRITTHTHTHAQCSLYNPKSPAPRSSPKLSPRSNNDPPSFRRRLPTAKVVKKAADPSTTMPSVRNFNAHVYVLLIIVFSSRYDLQSRVLLHDGKRHHCLRRGRDLHARRSDHGL